MKLVPPVIGDAPRVLNPEGHVTLVLRNLGVNVIDNLHVTHDQFEVIDLTNNAIDEVGGIPEFTRLHTLLMANNHVKSVGDIVLPLVTLVSLANNRLNNLASLFGKFPNLRHLVLAGNPLPANYRAVAVWMFPNLQVLDFEKVTAKERDEGAVVYGSVDNPTKKAQADMNAMGDKGVQGLVEATTVKKMGEPEKMELLERLLAANTIEEIEAIEAQLNVKL